MRIIELRDTSSLPKNLSRRLETISIGLSFVGFLFITGIYFLFI